MLYRNLTSLKQVRNVLQCKDVHDLNISRLVSNHLNGVNIITPTRFFRTSNVLKAIPPPLITAILIKVIKIGGAFLTRVTRRWWTQLTPNQRALYLQRLRNYRLLFAGLCGTMGASSYLFYRSHIVETPITNRKRFLMFTHEQYEEIIKMELNEFMDEIKEDVILSTSDYIPPECNRVSKVILKLLDGNKELSFMKAEPWTIFVVKGDGIINAIVFPNRWIIVYTGMLNFCETDDELAIVLGHEMAHAILSHAIEGLNGSQLAEMLLILPLTLLWLFLPSDLSVAFCHFISSFVKEVLMELPHSRLIEEEADHVGLILASKACFDIREASHFWSKMALLENLSESIADDDTYPVLPWMSTHPSSQSRVSNLEQTLPFAMQLRESCKCPLLPASDLGRRFSEFESVLKAILEKRTASAESKSQTGREIKNEEEKSQCPTSLAM